MRTLTKEQREYRGQLREQASRITRDSDVVLVEGHRDRVALDRLDVDCRVLPVASLSLDAIEDRLWEGARVTILLDYDQHGEERAQELARGLTDQDLHHAHRRQFGALLKQDSRYAIEDIAPLFEEPFQQFVDAHLDRLFTGLS